MARKKHLINVHTSTGTTAPTGASLYLGEIAVQHTPNDPALWIKVGSAETSTEYEKFIGLTEITNIFNMSHILGSGYTYSGLPHVNSATTIADAYSALTEELIDDELVTAAALNDLNDRIGSLSGLVSEIDIEPLSASVVTNVQNISILSGVVEENELVTAAALNDLNDKINMISANTSGDYITREEFEDHEEVAAAAFNDLNSRIIDLSGDTDERINNINSQFTVLSGMVLELSGNSGAGAITSVTIDGSGNVVTNATYINSALTITKGIIETGILGSGYTYSGLPYVNSATSIADAYSALTKEIIDDEKVTAAALNDLNGRFANVPSSADVENLSAVVYTLSATLEDDELVIAATLNDLNDKVNVISANTSGNFLTVEEYEENEEVIAAALNDLNARIIDLSGDTSDISDSVSNYGQQIQVLSGIVADISGNTGGGGGGGEGAVTGVSITGTGNAITNATFASKQLTLTKGNVVTGVTMNGAAKTVTNGVVNLGTVLTSSTDFITTGSTTQTKTGTLQIGSSNTSLQPNGIIRLGGTNPYLAIKQDSGTQYYLQVYQDKVYFGPTYTKAMSIDANGNVTTTGSSTAGSFIKSGGTSSQFLKADGSVDSTAYATTGTVNTLNNTVTAHTADTTVHVTSTEKSTWNGKQDAIADLETIRSNAAAGAAKVSNVQADWNATTGLAVILNKPTIPSAPGTLTTTATTAQSTATNEALTGNISLHKVSKTGSYNDLTNKPTIPTVPAWATASTKPTYTASEVGALPTGTTLDGIADGTTRKLSNYATTGTVNTHTGTTIPNRTSGQMHLPTVSASDNGKILMVKNGVWVLEEPSTITYSSSAPSGGKDGDIWIQTS